MYAVKNLLALRVGSPDKYVVPPKRLAEIGVQGLEIVWPDGATVDDVRGMVEPHGIRVTSITVKSSLADADFLAPYEEGAARAKALGASVLFTSLRAEDMPMDKVCERLRKLGDVVASHGVSVALETHPDLCENGDKAAATMTAVNHPNVGVNFDTANIYYYNENVSTMGELQKALGHVVAVHLKDSTGGFHNSEFPVFGDGVVDFAGVFDLLNGRGFYGPFSMELEGRVTTKADEDGQAQIIAACVDHLRQLGKI